METSHGTPQTTGDPGSPVRGIYDITEVFFHAPGEAKTLSRITAEIAAVAVGAGLSLVVISALRNRLTSDA